MHLYSRASAVALTAPVVFASYPHLQAVTLGAMERLKRNRGKLVRAWPAVLLGLPALLILFILLVSKALFPTVDHDALTHYNQYFNEVIRNHGILPNNVWYHYYFTKGAGLQFLSILLTDHLGPQLVSFCFVTVTALTLFSLVRKVAIGPAWPLLAVIMYLAAFVHTTSPKFTYVQWAVFQKQHEVMASLIAAMVWMAIQFPDRAPGARRCWVMLWLLIAAYLVVFVPTSAALVLPFFAVCVVVCLVARRFRDAGLMALLAGGTLVVGLAILAINYFATGLFEVTPMRVFWPLADQGRFSRWTSPYMMLYLIEGSNRSMGAIAGTWASYEAGTLIDLLRLEKVRCLSLHPLGCVVLPLVIACVALLKRLRPARNVVIVMGPIMAMILIAVIVSPFSGQPISVYRYYSFTVFLVVGAGVILWWCLFDWVMPPAWRRPAAIALVGCAAGWVMIDNVVAAKKAWRRQWREQWRFAAGRASFKEAYATVGIYNDGIASAKAAVGSDARVVCFHNWHGIGAVPGRDIETEISYSYPEWHVMAFGAPAAAKEALIRQGLNYFFIDIDRPFFGVFVRSAEWIELSS
jgi:hypothetical protein